MQTRHESTEVFKQHRVSAEVELSPFGDRGENHKVLVQRELPIHTVE